MITKSTLILTFILLFIFNKTLSANEKQKITENFNSINSLKFDFNQISRDKQETGKCFLKRPHFLKCIYEDKNQKQLIINKNTLIIHQARYNKSYFYPTKTSYFLDILDKKKFESLILSGSITQNNNHFKIIYSDKNKGEIVFFFDLISFDLEKWEIVNLDGSKTTFVLKNIFKNLEIDKELFQIPNPN